MEWKGLWTYVGQLIPGSSRGDSTDGEEEYKDAPKAGRPRRVRRRARVRARGVKEGEGADILKGSGGAEGSSPARSVRLVSNSDSDSDSEDPDEEEVEEEERNRREERREDRDNNNDDGDAEQEDDDEDDEDRETDDAVSSSSSSMMCHSEDEEDETDTEVEDKDKSANDSAKEIDEKAETQKENDATGNIGHSSPNSDSGAEKTTGGAAEGEITTQDNSEGNVTDEAGPSSAGNTKDKEAVVNIDGDERERKADGTDDDGVAGTERKGDGNLRAGQEARKFDEKAESVEGIGSCGGEGNGKGDVGGGTDREASRMNATRGNSNDDKTAEEEEKDIESEDEEREGNKAKHTTAGTGERSKGKMRNKQNDGGEDQQQDPIDEKEKSNNPDERNSAHFSCEGTEPPGNENEKACGQLEAGPEIPAEGSLRTVAGADASTDEGSDKTQTKGREEATEVKESDGDIVLNGDAPPPPSESGGTGGGVERKPARRSEEDNLIEADNATEAEATRKTHNETAAAFMGAAAAHGTVGEWINGSEQSENRRKEAADDGTNCNDDDEVGVAQTDDAGNKKREDGLESKKLTKALSDDATEGKTKETGNNDDTIDLTNGTYGLQEGNIDGNVPHETPEEEEEQQQVDTQENVSKRCSDNGERETAIKLESGKNMERRTMEAAGGAIKKWISSYTRGEKRGAQAKKKQNTNTRERNTDEGEKDEPAPKTGEIERAQGTKEGQANMRINGSEDVTARPEDSPGKPEEEASRCDKRRGKRKQITPSEEAGGKMDDDKARAGEEEEEEEKKEEEEEDVATGSNEVKKETQSENEEKEDNSENGVGGGAGGGGGGGGGGEEGEVGGGGGKRRRRRRRTRGGSKKEMESEGERDLATQNVEARSDEENKSKETNENITNLEAEEGKARQGSGDKKGNLRKGRGTEVENKTTEVEGKQQQQHTARKSEHGGADGEEASLSSVRNPKATKGDPEARPRDAGMNGAPQFSDVAKQIMKEVQETRNRRNKCLRDLRSMKPKAARIYIARRYKERAAEKKTPQSASLGISEGQKDEDSLKSLSPIPEATSPSLPQSSPKTKKNSVDSSSPSEAVQDPASFVFSPGDHHEAQPMSKALQGSSVSLRREERGEKNRKSENSSTQENPGEARCSSSCSSSTTNNENKFQNEQGETFEGVEVAKKELISLKSSPPPLPLPTVDPSMVEGSEERQLDSGDTLTKNSPGTEAEATGGRTQQCLAAAGRVRVCGSAPSSVATAAATTTLQSRSSSSHFHNPDATHGKTIENSVQLTSDAVDNNGNIDAGGAVQGEGLLKVPGKLPPRVVEVKHKTGAGPSLEPPPPCNPPHSAGSGASATSLSSTQDPEQEKQGVKKTHAPKNGRDGRVSGAEQQSLANSSEVFDNADNESKEIGESGSSLKLNDHSQGAKKAEARTSMRQDDGKETEALEGPWATPQLARVVQELVVSRKFNMSSSQAKKRQQNLTRLDAQQKDRTLIFDSSRLIKAEDKSEVPPEPQNETSKGTQNPSQAQKSGSRSVSRIIGRKNRRGNGNGEHFAHGNPTKKGKQNQPQESKTARLTGEEEGRHKQTKPQIKQNSQDKNTKNESVQPEGRDGNAVEVGEIIKCEGNKAKLVEHDDSNTLQPPPRIEQLSRSPQHPRPRLRKIVENLTLVHNQASPRSSPQPGSPAFSSSLNSSPRFIENSPRSPSGVSPLPISPRTRASKMVALSPRFVEALSPPEVEIVDGKNVTEAMQGGSSLQQHFEARAPSSSAQRDNVQREDNTSVSPTPRKSKEGELLSPLRRTSTRNDAPTELIFNFMKLPEITTDSCSTKSDQKLPGSESSPQAESNAGQARNKERQRGPELQPSEVSKPGAGKLDSDILQFFESRQYKPREIVRNETLITEHFRGTNTKLRTHGDGRNRGAASRNMSKGSSCDIEPGRRDRTFSDPMEKSPRGSRNAGKLRSVKSFDDSSVVRSSASEEETEEENETRNIKKRKEEMTPERSNGKGKASKAHIEVATEVDDASENNIFITSVNDSNRGKTEATTDTARQQPTPSARDRPPKTEESEEQNNKRKAFAGISGSQNFTGEEGVYSATNFQENPKKIEAVPYNTIKSQNTSENGQRNSDKATDRPSVLSGNSPSPKGVGLDILQAGVTHGAKKQGGESDTVLNATKSVEEISDRKRLTNSNEVIVTSDSTSIPSLQREKGKETTPSVPRVTGVNPFMAVVQELQEKAGRGVGRRKEVECDGGLPLQDDLVGEVANSRSTTSSVHRVTPALPPLPPPPESSSGLASLTGSPGSNPNLDHRLDDRKPNTKDEKHHHDLSEGSRDASSGTELVVKNPEELEGAKKASRDSVIFHLTLVGSGGKREKDAEQITPELSPQSIVIQKKIHATSAVESEKRTFLETCVDDIEPQQQQQQGSPFPSQDAFNKTVAGVKPSKADHITGEDIEKIYDVINVTETNKTFNPGRGGGGGGGGNGGTGERAGRGGTAASRRLPKCHRRLTKTISEGSFSLDQQEPDTSDSSNQDPVKLPRPPSLLRSRTESEFSPERLASAAAVECEASSKASTVSEIFARGVYGRLKAKSHSAENIRMSSLSCVEIPFSHEPPALPSAALYPNVFSLSSSSSCRIVGVLKKKHSADDFLDSRKQRMDNQPIRGNGNSHGNPRTGQYPFALESACVKDEQAPQDTPGNDSKPPTAPPPSESTQRDTTAHQQAPEVQEKNISSSSQSGKAGKSSLSSNPSSETPIYQNIPEALLYQKKTEAAMVKNSQQSQMKEEQQKPSTGDQKKPLQKVIHIYENMPIVAGREPQEEGAVLESPKRITQPVPESSISGNDFPESTGSSSLPSTSPISDVFFPSKRATFEKTSLRRKQQPESESRIEKQKSNYMKQRSVRVGILKKQKSDITGVRLQKLQYFDTELPGELRRSYSLSGNGVQNKEPRSPKNGPEDDTGPDIPDTDAKQRGEGKEELSDLERRCHSSISNTSRSSTIDRILQSCAPCISSNTTSSTLDLSSPLPLSQSPQKKNVFYSGGESTGGTAGRLVRRQHPRAKHPYKSSYSSSDVTLLSSGALPEASHGANFGKQPTKAVQENSFKAAYHKGQSAPEQVPRTAEPAESCYINSSQDTGSTSGLASSETSSSLDEAANNSKQNMKDDGFAGCDRDSCTPTPEQSGGPNGDTDFYSELLDTILSVVDAQEQSFSAEVENLCFSEEAENLGASEGAASRLSERRGNQVQDNGDNNKAKNHKKHPTAVTSDSDSTTSVDSELAEVRRRITERFPPAPRADPEASQESVLASPSAVCPMPDCAACRSINFSEPLVFAFDQPITPPVLCEPERASSLPFVDHAIINTSSDHFIRSTSLPHDPDIYHSTQVMCRHDQDEEEYWSAGEETARGTPQGTPRHHSAFQGHLPQHLKHQPKPVPLRNELSSLEDSMTKASSLQDSSLQDSSPHDSSPLTDSGVEIKDHSELTSNQLVEEVSQLRLENEKLSARNRNLQSEVEELRRVKESRGEDDASLKPKIGEMTVELTHAKEALSALKADRKRLKAEKFDLLNQMKQLYATLEDKEKELRDFIRNYEQRMKDSDESLRHLAAERDETEREKWSILKHARDESERVVKLSTQLSLKEATVKKLQEELDMVRKQLNSVGYYSDAESVRTNGLPTPTASTPTCSPLPVATPTPTPNGRGSSADSGVRLSSDRESTASHDGGPGTPKESPSLSPLYATPAYCRAGDDQSGRGDRTPTSVQTPAPMSGLANSSANAGGLSRSAEHLCERLSEGGEVSKAQGTSTLMRKNHKSGGTWGSISRVFARQKKRAALDTSIYDGIGSDKRASWSPSSSLCASPLTEESYSEKLRLLEEAQHIPLERWKAPTVLAWLEVTLGMAQYGAMCAENVRSGKVLLELSDSELEAGLGITHPMHRKKLRLAIEELREPRLTRYPRISALGHIWVSSEWLPDLGLPQYSDNFANSLVDGRLLEALTKKELEKHLGVHRKFHQASIIHGVHLLRIVRFDRQVLAERRRQSELVDTDPVVWTNLRWVRWARSIDLAEYAENLKDSGVHGALVVLEPSFTADTMATALGIPQSKNIIRRHLATELEGLVNPARQQLDEQARYAKMERRRQEKLASGGSLGRSFSRSYGTGLEKGDKDKRRSSLRGSLSRALGLRMREETASVGSTNGGGESSSSGGQSPAVTTRAHPRHGPHARPRSSIMPSQAYFHHETHRRVKSIGDIETITVTPV